MGQRHTFIIYLFQCHFLTDAICFHCLNKIHDVTVRFLMYCSLQNSLH